MTDTELAAKKAKDFASEATSAARGYASATGDKIMEYSKSAVDATSHAVDEAGGFVKQYPVMFAAGAFGLGFLFAELCRGKH